MNNCGTGAEKVCRFVSTRFFECAQNDTVFYLRPKRKLIRSQLINGMCNFKDGIGAARRRPYRASDLTKSTRMRGILLRSCHVGEVA